VIQELLQSSLETAGSDADRVLSLWRLLLALATAVFVVVLGLAGLGLIRARRDERPSERRIARSVAAGGIATVTILLFVTIASFTVDAERRSPRAAGLLVKVTGHQWWWEVEYVDSMPQRRLTTANEIHIPVGRPVMVQLESQDVIHSLWVPSLGGKTDLIPGKTNTHWIEARRPGVYRGQCAEFCGHQHALMGLLVVAESPAEFARWYDRQLAVPAAPTDSVTARGQEVFLTRTCVMCHAIEGTPAGSRVGPPLTHLGSRRTLAAGTLANTKGHLAGWILDPQRIKPGVRMPPNPLPAAELHALLAYLGSLK
jgi:cytochrome c oxidase subunit II